jgi:hypothetical protein
MFFDITGNPEEPALVHAIATEKKAPRAPLELSLQTHRKILAGNHELHFYLTYFNGREWRTDRQSISLTVPNWFRRHEVLSWTLGVASVVITVGGALIPLVRWLVDHIPP